MTTMNKQWTRVILFFLRVAQVVTQFKTSLVGLAEILMSKQPWYVRCIKPNDAKQPGEASRREMFEY